MSGLTELIDTWRYHKRQEQESQDLRREIEDKICALLEIPIDLDGVATHGPLKITGRIDRKVDGDLLQELALEAGLTEHLSSLFRWRPEINKKAWDSADELITRPLTKAITSKPGRPSFAIVEKKEG